MSEGKLTWHRAGVYKGVFEGFWIQANCHVSEDGRLTAWHTTSFSNAGDLGHRDYWVVAGQFRKVLKTTIGLQDAAISTATGEVIDDSPDPERKAILKAIEEWSQREPDVS
jgi:hypothetical protein